MANKKKIVAKSKTKTSKYSKLMAAASKELADKKKTLAKAEKTLAAATKNHQELLQEIARLDMLERSLKALVEGTEPPQNVRYVYTYPQWVWGNPYGWYNTYTSYPYSQPGNSYTITLGAQNPTYNAQSGNLGYNAQSGFTTAAPSNSFVTTTTGSLGGNSASSDLPTFGGAVLNNCSVPPSWQTFTTTTSSDGNYSNLTVDLSTGAGAEPDPIETAAEELVAEAK